MRARSLTSVRRLTRWKRLTALYLLTYCDSKANGSQNFSHVVKHNLKSLYEVARTRFVGQEETQWGAFAPVEEFQAIPSSHAGFLSY